MRKTVLIVEDDAALRTRCRKFLEWENLNVLAAENESVAFRILEEHPFKIDLVLVGVTRKNQIRLDQLKMQLPDASFLLLSNQPDSSGEHVKGRISRDVFYPESLVPQVKRMLSPREDPGLCHSL